MIDQRRRGEVIERFINIEELVNSIISLHYFRRVDQSFMLQVLYDEYCSFALRRGILEKILPDFDKQRMQDLRKLSKIRNVFAHMGKEWFFGEEDELPATDEEVVVVDSRKIAGWDGSPSSIPSLDSEAEYREFMRLAGPLEEYLGSVLLQKGARMIKGEREGAVGTESKERNR